MSEEKDIREDLKPSYGDYSHTGVKAGLSLVPIIDHHLRWLDKCERIPGEEFPMGRILCAGKSDKQGKL